MFSELIPAQPELTKSHVAQTILAMRVMQPIYLNPKHLRPQKSAADRFPRRGASGPEGVRAS